MKKEEIDTLMRAIKNTYPSFSITKGVIEEWTKRLVNYDYEDIEHEFNNYVLSGNKETISIIDLIKNLQTKEQKKPIKGIFWCKSCNKHYNTIEEMEKCEEKDMDIRYIKKMCNKFGINPNEYFGNLDYTTLERINKNYDNFILRVCKEQQNEPKLNEYELIGLRDYYRNVLIPKGMTL